MIYFNFNIIYIKITKKMNFTNIDDITDYINSFNLIFYITILSLLLLYKINELSYLKKTHCYITQNLVETNNKIILLEKKLKELDEENNYKFSIISDSSNLLDINSEIIKTNGYDRIFLDGNRMPHNINCSEQLYTRFLQQFRNIKIIEIEFLENEKHEKTKFDIMRILIEAFRDFEIIFKCVSLYSEYENFFNIIMNSSNYRKITLYIKDNLNVNKQTGNASYVTHPYINELKSHCIENNIEIQSNIGI